MSASDVTLATEAFTTMLEGTNNKDSRKFLTRTGVSYVATKSSEVRVITENVLPAQTYFQVHKCFGYRMSVGYASSLTSLRLADSLAESDSHIVSLFTETRQPASTFVNVIFCMEMRSSCVREASW